GLDGCVQSDPHYYLVGTTLAGQWRDVQTALLMRLPKECLAIEVDTSLPGKRVVDVLERLAESR
ncbi:hypothetical protein RCH09_003257, partial [Actimicrobium sp. GrIS 1.19]|nr:hypothetical protein [Actimicrobium sp. GrIS 1.19]